MADITKNILPHATVVALGESLTSEEFTLLVKLQVGVIEIAKKEAAKALDMYNYCVERGKGGGRRYICKYHALTKMIEGGYKA